MADEKSESVVKNASVRLSCMVYVCLVVGKIDYRPRLAVWEAMYSELKFQKRKAKDMRECVRKSCVQDIRKGVEKGHILSVYSSSPLLLPSDISIRSETVIQPSQRPKVI